VKELYLQSLDLYSFLAILGQERVARPIAPTSCYRLASRKVSYRDRYSALAKSANVTEGFGAKIQRTMTTIAYSYHHGFSITTVGNLDAAA
jgi:hypothetical protein